MAERVICELCGTELDVHASYVVKMDVFAEPSMPPMTSEQVASTDFDQTVDELLEQMESMTTDDLQDTVHRHFEYRLCPSCQRAFLANPLGKPRKVRAGTN